MIKTIKEIFLFLEEGNRRKTYVVPVGTYLQKVNYLINDSDVAYWEYPQPELQNHYIEEKDWKSLPDYFVEVVGDEPEIKKMVKEFADLLDRQDINEVFKSIKESDEEPLDKIEKHFSYINIPPDNLDLYVKIKDLETQLFMEKEKSRPSGTKTIQQETSTVSQTLTHAGLPSYTYVLNKTKKDSHES